MLERLRVGLTAVRGVGGCWIEAAVSQGSVWVRRQSWYRNVQPLAVGSSRGVCVYTLEAVMRVAGSLRSRAAQRFFASVEMFSQSCASISLLMEWGETWSVTR